MITKLIFMGTYAKAKLSKWVSNERGDVNIVSIVVLCGIVVILAIVFKDGIKTLLSGLFKTIGGTADKAVTGS